MIALYNAGTSLDYENAFTKVEVTSMNDLSKEENRKKVYVEETYYSYFVIAFYEDGQSSPSILIQVEKFPFSDLMNNSMEEWMKFLKVLVGPSKINDAPQVSEELLAKIVNDTKLATSVATKWTTATACNLCVRAAVYLIKADSVLFPQEGSMYHDPKKSFVARYIKGFITGSGNAKSIKADFDNISNRPKIEERFVEIERESSEEWVDYYASLQTKADEGKIIVGVMLNSGGTQGHVMMITPGGLLSISKETDAWGESFVNKEINKVPRVLECGGEDRENAAPLCRNVDRRGATERLKWFEYLK